MNQPGGSRVPISNGLFSKVEGGPSWWRHVPVRSVLCLTSEGRVRAQPSPRRGRLAVSYMASMVAMLAIESAPWVG